MYIITKFNLIIHKIKKLKKKILFMTIYID